MGKIYVIYSEFTSFCDLSEKSGIDVVVSWKTIIVPLHTNRIIKYYI
jgi:hypothetical protein